MLCVKQCRSCWIDSNPLALLLRERLFEERLTPLAISMSGLFIWHQCDNAFRNFLMGLRQRFL